MDWKRKKRVRIHLIDDHLPSIEGILTAKRPDEYLVSLPQLHFAANANPAELEAKLLAVPRRNVAFYEVL